MKPEIAQQLVDINDKFYQSFGAAFAETRRRIQPGVQRMIDQRIQNGRWLDLGCGSGVLGQRLAQRGIQGSYLGLDFSGPLLTEAIEGAQALAPHPGFEIAYQRANLFDMNLEKVVGSREFDGVLAFAVLHHLPDKYARVRLLHQVSPLLKNGGLFIHSEWQFQNNPKLLARVQPWSSVGLSDEDVDAGDTLLDWRHFAEDQPNEPGLRYVHLFTRPELVDLARSAGFNLVEEFDSDGFSSNLGLYQVWQKPG